MSRILVRVPVSDLNMEAISKMKAPALMELWRILGCSAVGPSDAQGDLKGYVSNLACVKNGHDSYTSIAQNCLDSFLKSSQRISDLSFYCTPEEAAPYLRKGK